MLYVKLHKNIWIYIFISILIFWLSFYPGFMNIDSILQYTQAKELKFNDWQPPIMAWVWSITDFFIHGPSGMLALHIALLWFSIYAWWKSYNSYSFSWLILIIPFLPWIFNFSGVIWKDVSLAFALLALSSLLVKTPSLGKCCLALILVFYSVNVRQNSIFAILPILFTLYYVCLKKPSILKSGMLAIITIFSAIYLGGVFNYKILHAEKRHPISYMMIDDLSYLSIKNNKSFFPGVKIDEITECGAFELGQNKLVGKSFCLAKQPSYINANINPSVIRKIWIKAISAHPIEYIQFRMAAFSYLLRSPNTPPYFVWYPGIDENSYGFKVSSNGISFISEKYVYGSANFAPFLFKPYWWFFISVLLLIITFAFASSSSIIIVRCLLSSSILYILGYLPTTAMADLRYTYWSLIASTLAIIVFSITLTKEKISLSKRKLGLIILFSVIWGLFIFNHNYFTNINIENVISKTSQITDAKSISIGDPAYLHNLKNENGNLIVEGDLPQIFFNTSALDINIESSKWLKFDFSCIDNRKIPQLKLYWWDDLQDGPVEEQNITRAFVDGTNLLPISLATNSAQSKKIGGFVIILLNKKACSAINIKNIEFLKMQ